MLHLWSESKETSGSTKKSHPFWECPNHMLHVPWGLACGSSHVFAAKKTCSQETNFWIRNGVVACCDADLRVASLFFSFFVFSPCCLGVMWQRTGKHQTSRTRTIRNKTTRTMVVVLASSDDDVSTSSTLAKSSANKELQPQSDEQSSKKASFKKRTWPSTWYLPPIT